MFRALGYLRIAGAVSLIAIASIARAQETTRRAPDFQVPENLAVYADSDRVRTTLKDVIEFLGTTAFEKNEDEDGLTAECSAIYRGMQLVHSGLYLFASKQEVGWFEHINPTQTTPPRKIVDFGRSSLLRVWSPDRIQELMAAVAVLKQWPDQHQSDLKTFLETLKDFRLYYSQLMLAKSQLSELRKKEEDRDSLRYWRRYLSAEAARETAKRLNFANGAFDFDAELRLLINRVRMAGSPALDGCLEAGAPFKLASADPAQMSADGMLLPISYMVGFWTRRDAEGTGALTEFLIEQLINDLGKKQ